MGRRLSALLIGFIVAATVLSPAFAEDYAPGGTYTPLPPVVAGPGPVTTPVPPPVDPIVTAANEAHAREVAAASGGPCNGPCPYESSYNQVQTTVPPAEQVGSWAVVDSNGKVINAIACQEIVCGANGSWHGVINSGPECAGGCQLVLQAAPNPITGQSAGGWTSSGDVTVTYKDGAFNIVRRTLAPGTTIADGKYVTTLEVLKDGISTNADGIVYDYVNKKMLDPGHAVLVSPAQVFGGELDAGLPIEQVFADAIAAGTVKIQKSKSGYLIDTNWDTAKSDKKLIGTATKRGAPPKKVTLILNEDGDLVINSKASLKGYQLSVKVNKEVTTKVLITS
jgi:hypothetical protein